MLLVHGQNSLDIFKALVELLKSKCIEFFGETLVLSRSTFEKDVEPLKEFFHSLGIKLFIELQKDINVKKCNSDCVLKDYKLWIKLPCKNNLAVSFDYDYHSPNPCHLE